MRLGSTLMFLPLKTLSLRTRACATRLGSLNSTYAYLPTFALVPAAVYQVGGCLGGMYPLGWPVNLSSKIVTRLMDPQLWKCAWSSSGEVE